MIVAAALSVDLSTLADLADKIMEVGNLCPQFAAIRSTATTSSVSQAPLLSHLEQPVASASINQLCHHLDQMIAATATHDCSRHSLHQ